MAGPDNNERAAWARVGIFAFAEETGIANEDIHMQVTDFLCDLMHLADYEELDWENIVRIAEDHYNAEVFEEGKAQKSPREWSPREEKRKRKKRK